MVPTPKRAAGRPTHLVYPPLTVSSRLLPTMPLQITAMAHRQASPKAFRIVLPLQPLQALFIPPLSIHQLRQCPDRSAPVCECVYSAATSSPAATATAATTGPAATATTATAAERQCWLWLWRLWCARNGPPQRRHARWIPVWQPGCQLWWGMRLLFHLILKE